MRNPFTGLAGFGAILSGVAAAIACAVGYAEQAAPFLAAIAAALAGLGNLFARDAE